MRVQSIGDPSPVWDQISTWMSDDTGELDKQTGPFIGVFDDDVMAGAFLIRPWNTFCYEIHGGVDPDYWGKGHDVCHALGVGIFKMTPCLKIVAAIPEYNRLMRKCVQAAGLTLEGVVKKSFVKRMKAHDLYVYGITRGEGMPCRQQQ